MAKVAKSSKVVKVAKRIGSPEAPNTIDVLHERLTKMAAKAPPQSRADDELAWATRFMKHGRSIPDRR